MGTTLPTNDNQTETSSSWSPNFKLASDVLIGGSAAFFQQNLQSMLTELAKGASTFDGFQEAIGNLNSVLSNAAIEYDDKVQKFTAFQKAIQSATSNSLQYIQEFENPKSLREFLDKLDTSSFVDNYMLNEFIKFYNAKIGVMAGTWHTINHNGLNAKSVVLDYLGDFKAFAGTHAKYALASMKSEDGRSTPTNPIKMLDLSVEWKSFMGVDGSSRLTYTALREGVEARKLLEQLEEIERAIPSNVQVANSDLGLRSIEVSRFAEEANDIKSKLYDFKKNTLTALKYVSYAALAAKVSYDAYTIYTSETYEESYDAAMSLSYTAGSYAFGVMCPQVALPVQGILLFDSLVTREYTKAIGEYMADAVLISAENVVSFAGYAYEAMPGIPSFNTSWFGSSASLDASVIGTELALTQEAKVVTEPICELRVSTDIALVIQGAAIPEEMCNIEELSMCNPRSPGWVASIYTAFTALIFNTAEPASSVEQSTEAIVEPVVDKKDGRDTEVCDAPVNSSCEAVSVGQNWLALSMQNMPAPICNVQMVSSAEWWHPANDFSHAMPSMSGVVKPMDV